MIKHICYGNSVGKNKPSLQTPYPLERFVNLFPDLPSFATYNERWGC